MNGIRRVALVMSAFLAMATAAFAQAPDTPAKPNPAGQKPAGQRQARGGRQGNALARMPVGVIDMVVSLKDDQKTKIKDIQDKLKTDLEGAKGDRMKTAGLNKKAADDIKAVLTPEQAKTFAEAGPMLTVIQQSKAIPMGVLPDLKLTTEQKDKIKAAAADEREKVQALPREERRAKTPEMMNDFKTKVEGILTPDQKQIIAKAPKPKAKPKANPKPKAAPDPAPKPNP